MHGRVNLQRCNTILQKNPKGSKELKQKNSTQIKGQNTEMDTQIKIYTNARMVYCSNYSKTRK